MKTIYIGNLPFATTEEEIHQLFAAYGDVHSVNLIMDPGSGMSRGFGFLEMNDDDAAKAVEELDATELEGQEIRVCWARLSGEEAVRNY